MSSGSQARRKRPHPAANGDPIGGCDPTFGGTKCGAKKKQGPGYCTKPAGYRTEHFGAGRCRFHGGATPIKHGRYSSVQRKTLRSLIAEFENDPDPTNLRADIIMMRALFRSYIDRRVMDPVEAGKLLAEATKIVERQERILNANAVSRPELNRIMHDMGRVVELCVEDVATREKISEGWMNIRMP